MYTTVVLIERRLSDADVTELIELHGDEEDRFFVLIPGEGEHGGLVRTLDDLALGELRQAAEDVEDDVRTARADRAAHHAAPLPATTSTPEEGPAHAALTGSLDALRAEGATAEGAVAADDMLDTLKAVCVQVAADEVIVMTRPHLVEEFFHRDWASRARRATGLPVLKLIAHQE